MSDTASISVLGSGTEDAAASVARGRVEPAPSAPIAQAARAFGDEYSPAQTQWLLRLAAVALAVASVWYLPWLIRSLDMREAWLAVPFAAANAFTIGAAL